MTAGSPREFWQTREAHVAQALEPALSHLSGEAARSREMAQLLGTSLQLLDFAQGGDIASLDSSARALRGFGERLAASPRAPAPPPGLVPGDFTSADSPLQAVFGEAASKAASLAKTMAAAIEGQARRCAAASAQARAASTADESRLQSQAQALAAQAEAFSRRVLTETTAQIKAIEASFQVAAPLPAPPAAPQPAPQAGGLNPVHLSHGAIGAGGLLLVGGFVLLGQSVVLGLVVAGVGAGLLAFGVMSLRQPPPVADLVTAPQIAPAPSTPGEGLRAALRQASQAAEQRVAEHVAPIKVELQSVKAALAGLGEKLSGADRAVWQEAANALATVRNTDGESLAKLLQAMQAICNKRQKLAESARASTVEAWKAKARQDVEALSVTTASPDGIKALARFPLGSARYEAPALVARHLGPVAVQLPYLLDLEHQGLAAIFGNATEEREAREVLTQAVLSLVIAARGRARLRLWDPRNFGAGFQDLLFLSGKALNNPRELQEALDALRNLSAERTAHLAKLQCARWSEVLVREPAAREDGFEVLLVAGFPAGFPEQSMASLLSLALAGQACGVFVLACVDSTELESSQAGVRIQGRKLLEALLQVKTAGAGRASFGPQDVQLDIDHKGLLEKANQMLAVDEPAPARTAPAGPLEIRFEDMYASETGAGAWTRSSARGIRVALGPAPDGSAGPELTFDDHAAHGLLVGGTGSGKSNLLHSVVQGIALAYSPQEVSLYLADLKDGVEFATYTRGELPHAKAIAVTADPQYAVAMVSAVNEEISRRNALFRKAGVRNIAEYREKSGMPLPRLLLVIDEFQVLFETRNVTVEVKKDLVNLCKQGRSSGVHVLLASQAIKGRTGEIDEVLGQLPTRIVMRTSKPDATMVTNSEMAARIFAACTRPGSGCIDKELGQGAEKYFQNPLVSSEDWFFALMKQYSMASGEPREAPVVWSDDARVIEDNTSYRTLERDSRVILLGEPYQVAHSTGFKLTQGRPEFIALASDSAQRHAMVIDAILKSALKSCGNSLRVDFIHSGDSMLDETALDALGTSLGGNAITRVLPAAQLGEALKADTQPQVRFLCFSGSADLSVPKRNSMGVPIVDPSAPPTDVDLIARMFSSDEAGRPHVIFCCRSAVSYVEQLAPIKDRISVRVFGPAPPPARLKDFTGKPELPVMQAGDLCVIRQDKTATVFKPFERNADGLQT